MARATVPLDVRLWRRVERDGPDDCWLWLGGRTKDGYGAISAGGRGAGTLYTHVVAYTLTHGPVPDGLELDHTCRVRHCCNPAHLEPVSHLVNVQRGAKAQATHCVHGHEFTEENTGRQNGGERYCRACKRERSRRYRERASLSRG